MPRIAPPAAAPLRALALAATLALAGCGGTPVATAPPAALVPATGAAAAPAPTPPGGVGRVPPSAPRVATADPAADRAAQRAQADLVLRALGALAAGQPAPPGLRPAVLDDLRALIDRSDRTPRRCLTELTVVGAVDWAAAPVAFVPLLAPDGSVVPGSRDAGVRLTTSGLEGYKTVASFPMPFGDPATPTALPAGSPCASAAPATPLQLPADRHRALRGEALVVLVEWRDGAWTATEATGTALP